MAQFGSYEKQIDEIGAVLIFIAAEKRGHMFKPEEFLRKHPVRFPFLLDEDRTVTKLYGIYHPLGADAIRIARPATFVVDRNEIIRYIYVGSSQTDRAPIEEVLEAAKNAK
jgi:peroxiredoxin Q/BCP